MSGDFISLNLVDLARAVARLPPFHLARRAVAYTAPVGGGRATASVRLYSVSTPQSLDGGGRI